MSVSLQESGEAARTVQTAAARSRSWRIRLIAYAFIAPTFVFILAFSYYPAIRALVGAFTQWDGFNPPSWVGLANFIEAFHDPVFLSSLGHVGLWTLVGIPLSLIPPFIVAEFIFQLKSQRAQYVYRTLFIISMVLPGVVGILIWQYIYEPSGLLNAVLRVMGLEALRHAWLANPHLALWAVILMGFPWVAPFNLLIYYAGLQAIPGELFDAAAVDGATRWWRVLRIDIPLVMAQVKLLLVLAIVGVSQNLLTPLLMTGGGPGNATTTPVFYMYDVAINFDQYGYGMAIAFMLFVVVMALALVNMRYFQSGD